MKLELLEACNRIIHTLSLNYIRYHDTMIQFEKLIKDNKLNDVIVEIDDDLDGGEDQPWILK